MNRLEEQWPPSSLTQKVQAGGGEFQNLNNTTFAHFQASLHKQIYLQRTVMPEQLEVT